MRPPPLASASGPPSANGPMPVRGSTRGYVRAIAIDPCSKRPEDGPLCPLGREGPLLASTVRPSRAVVTFGKSLAGFGANGALKEGGEATMSEPRAEAKAIFLAALECEGAEALARFLDQACGADATLRRRVEELL